MLLCREGPALSHSQDTGSGEASGKDATSEEWVANQTRALVTVMDQMFPERAERRERESAEESRQWQSTVCLLRRLRDQLLSQGNDNA